MSLRELAGLLRRQWSAIIVVFVLTVAIALDFKHTKPLYQDTGNVLFSAPGSTKSYASTVPIDTLIVTAYANVDYMTSPAASLQVRRAGGLGQYQFSLVNFYNQEYPDYSKPLATLRASSYSPVVAQGTFDAALRVIDQILEEQQSAAGTPVDHRITASLVGGSSGPVPQVGYPKRTLAGLGLLALVAAYFLASALDRHRGWRNVLRIARRIPAEPPNSTAALLRLGRTTDLSWHECG